MSLPERYISFARIILIFFRKGGLQPLQPPRPVRWWLPQIIHVRFPAENKKKWSKKWVQSTPWLNIFVQIYGQIQLLFLLTILCLLSWPLSAFSKKSNSQVRTNLRQKGTGKSSLKVTCILTMKSTVRFRKVAFARGHKNDQNRKLTLTFSLWWLLSHAEAGMKKGKLGLNILLLIYWLKLLDCTCWIYVYNKCLKFVSHKLCYTQQPLTMIGLYAFVF